MISDKSTVGKEYSHKDKKYKLARVEQFAYTDPVDKSVAKNEVISLPDGISDNMASCKIHLFMYGPLF